MSHLVNNISFDRGLGFMSLLSLALCSADREGSFAVETTEAEDTRELGRF